jgi:hypothetical protein
MALYTHPEWLAEYARLDADGNPEPCRVCGRSGFYGPRGDRAAGPEYRCCKFCGFWQRVGEESFVAIPTVHRCGNWPTILGAAQPWWEVPEHTAFDCPCCGVVGLRIADWLVGVPRDERAHPWWGVPQGRTQDEYRTFWATREPWLLPPFGYV